MRAAVNKQPNRRPALLVHLSLISNIAVVTSLVCVVGLLVLSYHLFPEFAGNYLAVVSAYAISREQMVPSMLFVTLLMISVTGIITWSIALYSSFRIAGPIYRMCRNIEQAISEPVASSLPLRQEDFLQAESQELIAAIDRLNNHYDQLEVEIDDAFELLQSQQDDGIRVAKIQGIVERITELDQRVLT